MNQECLTEPANMSLHITEEMDGLLEPRTGIAEDENSPCSADTTDAEVEELSMASSLSQSSIQTETQPEQLVADDTRISDVVTPPLPEGCQPLSHQVAGHIHGKGKTKAGLLQDVDGHILKPIQTQSRGKRERSFYSSVTKADVHNNPVLCGIRPFIPRYYGTYVDPGNPDLVYLRIDDVTKSFQKPCIMDIKIGLQSYESGAPPEKVKMAMLKYPYLQTVGFQILGMRVFHPKTGEYEYQDKYYGRALDQSKVIEGLARFLNVGENFRVDALAAILEKLEQIKAWFEGQQRYQFFSSSLLLVYEGDLDALTVNGASGDGAKANSASSNKPNSANVVSYSSLALNDSESILLASRDLKDMSNNVSDAVDQSGDTNGCVARLPSYKESVEVTKLLQNGTVNGEVANGCISSQESTNQNGVGNSSNNGVVGSQGDSIGSNSRGVTVGQMRELQRRFQPPSVHNASSSSISSASSHSAQGLVNGNVQPIVENGVEKRHLLADIKMIDFTHVVDVETTDENYLVGLRNLICQFRTLLECHSN